MLAPEDGKAFEAPKKFCMVGTEIQNELRFMSQCDAVLLGGWLLTFQRSVVQSCWRFYLSSPVIFLATLGTPHPTTHHHISKDLHAQ